MTRPSFIMLAALAVLAGAGLSACAGTASGKDTGGETSTAATRLHMGGRLLIKGNMPMTYPVLMVSEQEQWELQGVDHDTARRLQNRQVIVEGVVARAQQGARLRSLLVSTIRAAERVGSP